METKRPHFALIVFISTAIIACLAWYLYTNANKYLELLHLSALGIFALCLFSLAFPFLNGLINVYLFHSLGVRLSLREGFFLAGSASLANQLPFPGGIVARGVYLRQRYGLSYAVYFSASVALFVGMLVVNGLIGNGILLYLFVIKHEKISFFLLTGFVVMALSGGVFIVPVARLKIPHVIRNWIEQALQGWRLISYNRALLLKLLGLQTIAMLLLAARFWIAFRMLSQDIAMSHVLLMSTATILTQLVSLAPGGLGVREAVVGGVASALGFDITVSIAAVELDRVVSTFIIVLVGWISVTVLGKQLTKSVKERLS